MIGQVKGPVKILKETLFSSMSGWEMLWVGTPLVDRQDPDGCWGGAARSSVFLPDQVKIETKMVHISTKLGLEGYQMLWSVTRL